MKATASTASEFFAFRLPDVANLDATPSEVAVAHKYTRVRSILVDGEPDAHTAWFQVGDDTFRIEQYGRCGYSPSAEAAALVCLNFARTLLRIGILH